MRYLISYFQKYFKTLWIVMQIGIFFTYCSIPQNKNLVHANKVSKDSLVIFYESGQLESIETFEINAPRRWEMKYRILKLVPEGSVVQPGDTIVYFDEQPLKDRYFKAIAELKKAQEGLRATLEQNALVLEKKRIAIKQLKMQFKIDSSRLANARFESKTRQQEIAIDLEKTRLRLQKEVKALQSQKIINDTKERLQRIKIQQAQIELKRILLMKKEMRLVSQHSGVAIYPVYRTGEKRMKIKEGESVYPGQTVLQIANLNRMKAVLKLNEVDRQLVRIGQKALVTVDAYPDTVFEGRIAEIGRVAIKVQYDATVKVYLVDIPLQSKANFRLKPGLSVRVGVVLDTLKNAFQIPEWCLFEQEQTYWVQSIKKGKIPVHLMRRIDGLAFVQGKLKNGMILETINQ